ncbi:MAG: hypothetical protein F4Y69_09580 [Chloroflexi bacterium]|nr:hypothetical protein [Chloroflexota bacterium]MYF21427.1 hypothetical protein [Chloroflexota bacterium]
MSQFSRDPRGARDFSSPQVRVRGANDFRQYSSQRLRLPNERPPFGPTLRRLFGALVALAVVAGIGVGVYFGVTELLEEDDVNVAATQETSEPTQSTSAESAEAEPVSDSSAEQSAEEQSATAAEEAADSDAEEAGDAQSAQSTESQDEEISPSEDEEQEQQGVAAPSISAVLPTVSEEPVTAAQIGGAETVAERVTAEAIPSGIPRTLADGVAYDPTEPATVFTSRWPAGTTLRLTRLPGATLLTDEQQAEVVGAQALVVVRGTEATNTDLQMSPAAFDLIAFYGVERIIAVRVEVTAPPP